MHAPPITGNKSWRRSFKTSRLEAILTIERERDSTLKHHSNDRACVNETIMQSQFSFNVARQNVWGHGSVCVRQRVGQGDGTRPILVSHHLGASTNFIFIAENCFFCAFYSFQLVCNSFIRFYLFLSVYLLASIRSLYSFIFSYKSMSLYYFQCLKIIFIKKNRLFFVSTFQQISALSTIIPTSTIFKNFF